MAVTTPQEIVVLRVPAYDGDVRLPDYETLAEKQTGEVFGDCRNLAIALLMLHYMTLDDSRGGAAGGGVVTGSVKAEKEGDLSRQYGGVSATAQSNPDLSQTMYGLELIELRKRMILNPTNRMVGTNGTSHVLPTVF
jgi:hypothetical protein